VHTPVDRLLTVRDVAEAFQMTQDRVCELARRGDLPGLRIGRSWRFRASSVDAWSRGREAQLRAEQELA